MAIADRSNMACNGDTTKLAERKRRREHYRSDSVFRRKRISEVLKRHRERITNPVYRRLVQVRKDIWWQRERISRWTLKLENAERKLLTLLREKGKLENDIKATSKAVSGSPNS